MLTCIKCNYENELGRIFCHQCGTKLDLDSIKPPSRGGPSLKKSKTSAGRMISIFVRLLILAALIGVIVLIFQVLEVKNIATTPQDLSSFYRKRTTLETATFQKKPVAVQVTEAELNAFIDNVQLEDPQGRGVKVVPTNIQIDLGDNQATAYVIGKIKIGDKWEKGLGISYTGVPTIIDGKFVFKPKSAYIGKLPIPPAILENTGFIESYYSQVFGKMQTEIQLLNKLHSIAVDGGNVVLNYQPAASPAP